MALQQFKVAQLRDYKNWGAAFVDEMADHVRVRLRPTDRDYTAVKPSTESSSRDHFRIAPIIAQESDPGGW